MNFSVLSSAVSSLIPFLDVIFMLRKPEIRFNRVVNQSNLVKFNIIDVKVGQEFASLVDCKQNWGQFGQQDEIFCCQSDADNYDVNKTSE